MIPLLPLFCRSGRLSPRLLLWVTALLLCLSFPGIGFAQFNGPGNVAIPPAASAFPLTTDQTLLFPQGQDVRIAAGDSLAFHVFDQGDYSPQVLVDTTGSVLLPFIGLVHVAGLTTEEVDELVRRDLQDAGIYRDPQVSVLVNPGPGSVATVTGELKGVISILGSRPLLQVLASAGGLPASASRVITIQRLGMDDPIIVDLGNDPTHIKGSNVPILPGDTIIVSRIGVVYMMGSFRNPSTISLTSYNPLTLTEAATLAGGYTFEGKYNDLRIVRTVGSHRTVTKVDIKRVLYGKDPDPILQPNDIVFLPQSAWKASLSNGTLGTALGLFSLVYSVLFTAINN